jgi:hypothetical protein
MDYKDLASVSGKGGLFQIIKPTKSGVILESLDKKKSKLVAGANHRVSILDEISIYTTDQDESVQLTKILHKMHEEFEGDLGLDGSSSNEELRSFFNHVLPTHDEERVYPSDIKKVISWYKSVMEYAPELLKTDGLTTESKDSNEK